MPDLQITCPHCRMHITFGIGGESQEKQGGELLGFVFTCPSCRTPVSYQANGNCAVELDHDTFENFKQSMAKKFNNGGKLEGVAFQGPAKAAQTAQAPSQASQSVLDEDIYRNMLRDIRESESFDDFLKRIES